MPLQIYHGFGKAFKKLLCNTELHGLKYIVDEKRNSFERVLWFFIEIGVLLVTFYLTLTYWYGFMENPTLTARISSYYPVEYVPFPAISICNLNKISKSKLSKLGDFLISQNVPSNITSEYMHLLGVLYEYSLSRSDDLFPFQTLLEKYQSEVNNKSRFNTEEFLHSLVTPCHALLKFCRWSDEDVPCNTLFTMRLTFEGHCCTFNYLKNSSASESVYNNEFARNTPQYQASGVHKGLSVTINNNPSDYFFTVLADIGINVHIFHSEDYPDKTSGSLTEVLVPMGYEAFIEIDPTQIIADRSISQFSFEKRGCVFANERLTELGDYTQSDCFVDCRLKSFIALCECVPFMIPLQKNVPQCTLNDVPCLTKFNDKWKSNYPYDTKLESLSKEIHNGLRCDDICYSACENVLYGVSTNKLPLGDDKNETVLHIYYPKQYATVFKADVLFHWYEVLSSFGGLFGITMGLSLVSVIEVIVYLTYKSFCYSLR